MLEMLLPDVVKEVLVAIIGTSIVLVWLARRYPAVSWLRPFQFPSFQARLSDEQKARRRRFGNIQAGFEIMIAGLMIPGLYVVSQIMMFNDLKTIPLALSLAAMAVCFIVGIWVIVKAGR